MFKEVSKKVNENPKLSPYKGPNLPMSDRRDALFNWVRDSKYIYKR